MGCAAPKPAAAPPNDPEAPKAGAPPPRADGAPKAGAGAAPNGEAAGAPPKGEAGAAADGAAPKAGAGADDAGAPKAGAGAGDEAGAPKAGAAAGAGAPKAGAAGAPNDVAAGAAPRALALAPAAADGAPKAQAEDAAGADCAASARGAAPPGAGWAPTAAAGDAPLAPGCIGPKISAGAPLGGFWRAYHLSRCSSLESLLSELGLSACLTPEPTAADACFVGSCRAGVGDDSAAASGAWLAGAPKAGAGAEDGGAFGTAGADAKRESTGLGAAAFFSGMPCAGFVAAPASGDCLDAASALFGNKSAEKGPVASPPDANGEPSGSAAAPRDANPEACVRDPAPALSPLSGLHALGANGPLPMPSVGPGVADAVPCSAPGAKGGGAEVLSGMASVAPGGPPDASLANIERRPSAGSSAAAGAAAMGALIRAASSTARTASAPSP